MLCCLVLAYLPKLNDSNTDMDDMTYLGIPHGADEDPLVPPNFDSDFFGDDFAMANFEKKVGGNEGRSSNSDDEDDFNQGQGWDHAYYYQLQGCFPTEYCWHTCSSHSRRVGLCWIQA
ncbi:hypothetical protein L208DRAFT_1381703 [Tricholoma matsutake]|nr:hypothetical protein L208DRAFT_1381703 [Tricholoma matsutake 945]